MYISQDLSIFIMSVLNTAMYQDCVFVLILIASTTLINCHCECERATGTIANSQYATLMQHMTSYVM